MGVRVGSVFVEPGVRCSVDFRDLRQSTVFQIAEVLGDRGDIRAYVDLISVE